MLILALDTAGPDCAVALARDDAPRPRILAQRIERLGRGHAERLVPMIEEVLAAGSVHFDAVGRIAVTTGPGSFTGLRVGIAAARALSLALSIPAVGIGSLAALAWEAASASAAGTVAAALPTRGGEIFACARDVASGAVLFGPASADPATFALRLADAPDPLILTGAAAPLLAAALQPRPSRLHGLAEAPAPALVAQLGLTAAVTAAPLPIYARGADAKPQAGKAVARL